MALSDSWERGHESTAVATADEEDPFALRLPTKFPANQTDGLADAEGELRAFLEMTGLRYPALAVSATTGTDSDRSVNGKYSRLPLTSTSRLA